VILSAPHRTEVLAQGLQESRVEAVSGGGEGEAGGTIPTGASGTPQQGSSDASINGVDHVTNGTWQRNDSITPPSLAEAEMWNLLPGTTLSDQAKAAPNAIKTAFHVQADDPDHHHENCMAHGIEHQILSGVHKEGKHRGLYYLKQGVACKWVY
jgi:hypothetical protein